jgi:hypothetical protein
MRPEHIESILVDMHAGQWFGWSDSHNKVYSNLVIHSGDEKPTQEWLEAELKNQQDAYDNDYSRKRREAYEAAGCTIEALTIACFESVFADDSSAAVRLQIEREKIKAAIPK